MYASLEDFVEAHGLEDMSDEEQLVAFQDYKDNPCFEHLY